MSVTEQQPAWERLDKEPTRAYSAFRVFRDLGPTRTLDAAQVALEVSERTVGNYSARFDWIRRATLWDDQVHRIDDHERLEALANMHRNHQAAGRAAIGKALGALHALKPDQIPASAAARLLELGTRLERETLAMSVDELQGVVAVDDVGEDPWDRIARELQGT